MDVRYQQEPVEMLNFSVATPSATSLASKFHILSTGRLGKAQRKAFAIRRQFEGSFRTFEFAGLDSTLLLLNSAPDPI